MSPLTQSTLLHRCAPDERCYLQSLLPAAQELGVIDETFLSRFRDAFAALLTHQCRTFSAGRSRSMRSEMAESIGESVLFTLNAHLSRFEPIDALAQLQHRSLEDCFADGRKRIHTLIQSTQLLYMSELRHPLPVRNELLQSTLRDGISAFFRLYNPEYGAHEIHITADYPVIAFPQGFQGIEFIRRYLDALVLENRFLRLFPPNLLRSTLTVYAAKNFFSLQELHGNLFEIMLGCTLDPEAGPDAMLDDLRCTSPALRDYVLRTCREEANTLAGIRRFMQ